jgi:hypothetical protein
LSLLHQKAAELGIDPYLLSDADKLTLYQITLEALMELLFTDRRRLNSGSIDTFANDLGEILSGVYGMHNYSDYGTLDSMDGFIKHVTDAQDALNLAADLFEAQDMNTEQKKEPFYRLLSKCREHLSKALRLFT